jgi:hypothetical protein
MAFIPGIELNRRFYLEAVRPLLESHAPGVPHAAALLGPGSDVLGFDTEMSMDHDWGPRLQLFLPGEAAALQGSVSAMLGDHLPPFFAGFPVGRRRAANGVAVPDPAPERPLRHGVSVGTLAALVRDQLAYEVDDPIDARDWLTFPAQILRSLTAGAVYRDETGELTALRRRLAWYPHDVWLYLLACGWQRIGQEEHLMARAGSLGDEPGSALIGSRLVRDVMSLCFLMECEYAPYAKWFGTAFRRLRSAPHIEPALWRALQAAGWRDREAALCEAYEALATMHNALAITDPLPVAVSRFFDRPFRVIGGEARARALIERIADPDVRRIAGRGLIGSIDQISDSTDVRAAVSRRAALRRLYD